MELEDMLTCRGTEELHLSDDNDNNDDCAHNDNSDDYVAPAEKRGTTSSEGAHNLEGLVQERGMPAKESSVSENCQENIADRVTTYARTHMF